LCKIISEKLIRKSIEEAIISSFLVIFWYLSGGPGQKPQTPMDNEDKEELVIKEIQVRNRDLQVQLNEDWEMFEVWNSKNNFR